MSGADELESDEWLGGFRLWEERTWEWEGRWVVILERERERERERDGGGGELCEREV